MKRRFLLAAAAGAMTATLAMPALAQTKYKDEYKLSTVVPASFPWGKGGEIWADLVRQRTNVASTSRCTPACRWCRATRRASSRRSARASSTWRSARPSTGRRRSRN